MPPSTPFRRLCARLSKLLCREKVLSCAVCIWDITVLAWVGYEMMPIVGSGITALYPLILNRLCEVVAWCLLVGTRMLSFSCLQIALAGYAMFSFSSASSEAVWPGAGLLVFELFNMLLMALARRRTADPAPVTNVNQQLVASQPPTMAEYTARLNHTINAVAQMVVVQLPGGRTGIAADATMTVNSDKVRGVKARSKRSKRRLPACKVVTLVLDDRSDDASQAKAGCRCRCSTDPDEVGGHKSGDGLERKESVVTVDTVQDDAGDHDDDRGTGSSSSSSGEVAVHVAPGKPALDIVVMGCLGTACAWPHNESPLPTAPTLHLHRTVLR